MSKLAADLELKHETPEIHQMEPQETKFAVNNDIKTEVNDEQIFNRKHSLLGKRSQENHKEDLIDDGDAQTSFIKVQRVASGSQASQILNATTDVKQVKLETESKSSDLQSKDVILQ